VSVSHDTLGLWHGTGLPTERAVVALTSVDLETYRPAAAPARRHTRGELGISPEDFLVFFAGRIAPEKGVDVLVDGVRLLTETNGHCHLVVVGSPTAGHDPEPAHRYERELHARAEKLPVTWLPRRDDIVPLLQAADVAVVPSRWAEPLSRSILEPLACGVPVVASRVGGSPEVLTGWLEEFLVDAEDSAALARRLGSLAGWRDADPGLGERCRRHAEAHLAPDRELDLIETAMFGTRRDP
jgi:glycosyltransferase involved in cell wall biosynthesis